MIVFVVASACAPKQDPYADAVFVHDAIVTRSAAMHKRLDSLARLRVAPDTVQALRMALDSWAKNLSEIPGHHDTHEHHHAHSSTTPTYTPLEALLIQQELDSQLRKLEDRLKALHDSNQ